MSINQDGHCDFLSAIVRHDAQCKIFLVINIKGNVWRVFGDGLYVAMMGEGKKTSITFVVQK